MYPKINAQALVYHWKNIETKPSEKYKIELTENDAVFHKDLNVHRFFLFLKMLPCHRVQFKSAVKSFMVFTEVF